MDITLTQTERNILIDLVDEALVEDFIVESEFGPDFTEVSQGYMKLLEKLKNKLETT